MEDKIKNAYTVLSGGKKISSDEYIISSNHFNSITRDRFIAELNKNGIAWNGQDISYNLLLKKEVSINQNGTLQTDTPVQKAVSSSTPTGIAVNDTFSVGIDIQAIGELPVCKDFWEDAFYNTKFKPEEIAYCLKKENPVQSFAGIYACKEALIKCNNSLQWESIRLTFNQLGKPAYGGYQVSISHSGDLAVAVAFRLTEIKNDNHGSSPVASVSSPLPATDNNVIAGKRPGKLYFLSMVIMLAVIAYFIYRDFVVTH